MTTITHNDKKTREAILKVVMAIYSNFSEAAIHALVAATDNIGGVSFISLVNYSSDKSGNTELKSHTVNVGASYANMLVKDEDKLKAFDINKLDTGKIFWDKYNLKGVSQDDFTAQVKKDAPLALAEMLQPKAKKDNSHIFYFNKCLQFNTNTNRLSICGMTIKSTVTEKGTDFKQVASAPKTVAKELITKQADLSSGKLRNFCLDNLLATIKISGETLEIQCDVKPPVEMIETYIHPINGK